MSCHRNRAGYQVEGMDAHEVTREPGLVTINKRQVSEQCDQQTPAPPINKNKNENGESHCEFKRGGFCKVHNLQGSKYWIPTKTRKKKPNGIYGYVYGKKVGYKCSMTQFLPPINTDEKTNPIFNTDGVVCNTENQGVLSTFTTFNNLDESSRMKSGSRLPGNIF